MWALSDKEFKLLVDKEKNSKINTRMRAVHMVLGKKKTVTEVAELFLKCPKWVNKWVERFEEGGFDALRDLPRVGRPPKVTIKKITKIIERIDGYLTPITLQQEIKNRTGIILHITNIRKKLHKLNMTIKRGQRVHTNKASLSAIRSWQYRTNKRIPRLTKKHFKIFIQDESMFVHGETHGARFWSKVGEPVYYQYNGKHTKIVAYGSISINNKRFVRLKKKFTAKVFLQYLKEMHRKIGKIVVIVDRATQHTAGIVKKYLRKNKNVKLIYLPKASPELSVIEAVWRDAKNHLLVSKYYSTVDDMQVAMSEYFRTLSHDYDVMSYINRKVTRTGMNF